MREMAEELSGYLDVKVPARERRRGFGPWKAWKRQMCTVRRGDSVHSPVQVHLGCSASTRLQVSHGSLLWRTQSRSKQFAFGVFNATSEPKSPVLFLAGRSETETQKWMAHFRRLLRPPQQGVTGDFVISVIDNSFSQTAGLTGSYGNLKVTQQEVTLNDPCSDEVKVSWEWHHLLQCHLAGTGRTEDEKQICVLRTSSDWCGGQGQLYFYCDQAPQLFECVTQGIEAHNLRVSPYPSPTFPIVNTRRLSRSENDLRRCWTAEEAANTSNSFIGIKFRRKCFALRSNSSSRDSSKRTSTYSEDSGVPTKTKLGSSLPTENRGTSSLISASLGLVFSTPGCSDSESVHEYQRVGFSNSDEDLVGDMVEIERYKSPRRESGISIASGIYEEIPDHIFFPQDSSNVSPTNTHADTAIFITPPISPPPLPPRKRLINLNVQDTVSLCPLTRSRCFSTASSPQLNYPLSYTPSAWDLATARSRFFWPSETPSASASELEPDYLPMSPGINRLLSRNPAPIEEQHYMVMASINTT